MDIRINKGISIIISVIWILVSLFSLFMVYGFLYFTHNLSFTDIKWNWLFLLNLGIIIDVLISLVIGIWLYVNANNFNLDKWTWMVMGFIYGRYSLILLLLIIIFQKGIPKIDLLKAVQNLFILMVISYALSMLAKLWITPNVPKILDMKNGMYVSSYSQILDIVPGILMFSMNVILAVKLLKWISAFSLFNKVLWIVAVLISGLLPLILFNGLTIIKKEGNHMG